MSSTEVIKEENVISQENKKLSFGEKVALTISGGTGTFHNQMIQMFLLFFYTDMLRISPVYIGTLFVVVRVIDAFMAPIFGMFIDKVTTPWGKYKPWFIGLEIFIAVMGWLTFTDFNLGPTGKIIFATVTYFLYSTSKTIVGAPASAIGPAATKRLDDRISMGQMSYFLAMTFAMLASGAVPALYKKLGSGNDAKGFSLIMGVILAITLLISLYQSFKIKERYVVQPNINKDGVKDKVTVKEMITSVITNKACLIALAYTFGLNLSGGIRSAITIYYMKYYFHNEGLMAIIAIVGMVPTLVGVTLSSKLTKRIGIRNNLAFGSVVGLVSSVAVLVIPATQTGIIIYIIINAVGGFVSGISMPASGTMTPAAMDYSEWKTGKSVSAFMGSLGGFLQTFSTALSGAIAAGALSVIGYVAGAEQQSSSAVFGFRILMSILPAVALIFTLAVFKFDLTEEKQAQIGRELAERRRNAEQNATN